MRFIRAGRTLWSAFHAGSMKSLEGRMRLRIVGLFAAAIVGGMATGARADTFGAGSIIIPMDECYQYNGTQQNTRLGWNQGALPNRVNSGTYPVSTFDNNNLATAQCIGLDVSTVSNKDPFDQTCWGDGFTPSVTGIQHAFGLLYYLASNNIPVAVAIRTNKEALGDYDFSIASADGTTNPVYA